MTEYERERLWEWMKYQYFRWIGYKASLFVAGWTLLMLLVVGVNYSKHHHRWDTNADDGLGDYVPVPWMSHHEWFWIHRIWLLAFVPVVFNILNRLVHTLRFGVPALRERHHRNIERVERKLLDP